MLEVQSREQLLAGGVIEQPRDGEAIAGLIGPYGGLRLGRIDAIDRAGVKPEVLQMCFRDLDVSSVEEPTIA